MNRRGLALLIVVGVLGILAVLATAFVTMAQLERRASSQRLAATKATLLARSGIEDAMARLSAGQDPEAGDNRYLGEDWNGDGILNAGPETQDQVYRITAPGTAPDTDACPVSAAMRPSFCRMTGGSPRRVSLDGRQRGYTGALAGERVPEGNTYALRVLTEGGLYVNCGDPSVPVNLAVPDYNLNLRRMLGILAEAIDREDGVPGNGPVAQADGFNLIDLRPNTGWEDWNQVRDLAFQADSPSVRQTKLDALRPYLTLQARVDRKVIRLNAVPGMEGMNYQSWADIKLAHRTYPALPGNLTIEPDFERIPVAPGGKLVGRAPVDLAWARTRRPVLIALLAGLKGLYLDESTASPFACGDRIGTIRSAQIGLSWTSADDDCRLAAGRILASTSELRTWDQWDAFCDGIPFSGTSDVPQAKRDLLKANFNPNSRLNKFSPNTSLWKSVDKSDLLAYSTEFSLLPQVSPQDLESAGRILAKDGHLLASRVLRAAIAPAGLLTLTTQKEFVCGELGDLSVAGDEQALRQPGQTPFISRSAGTGKTWGHAMGQSGLGTMGASLQTFPEPCVDTGSGLGLSTRAAGYDGSVQLATVETPAEEFYTVTAPPKDMKLLARYTANLDLDVSDAAPTRSPGDPKWRNQPDILQVTYVSGLPSNPTQLAYGLLHPTRPNTLYPDGVYSEKDRAPSYFDRGNANGIQGLISFWIKSNHAPPTPYDHDPYGIRGHPFLKWTNVTANFPYADSLDQFFFLGDSGGIDGIGPGGVSCFFEVTHSDSDPLHEHLFQRNPVSIPHQWSLVTMYYDFQSPAQHDCGELLVNAGIEDSDRGSLDTYGAGDDSASAMDITTDHIISWYSDPVVIGPHRLFLGGGCPNREAGVPRFIGIGADATFDELALYDFGGATYVFGIAYPAPDATLASAGVLASNRFKEGRYYKETAYPNAGLAVPVGADLDGDLLPDRRAAEYFSPPIRLGACRIRAIVWTQVVPRGLKAPLPSGGQAGVHGDPGDDGRIILELTNDSGDGYLKDVAGQSIAQAFTSPAVSRVERTVNAPFRLHAIFQPNLADKDNTPILDPIALDDVTVVYEPLGGRRIVAWE